MKRFFAFLPVLLLASSAYSATIIVPGNTTLVPGVTVVVQAALLDPDALNWQTNIVASGSTVSVNTLAAASAFCVSAKANGYWTKLTVICPIAGTDRVAATHYLKYPAATVKATENGTAMTYAETGASGGVVGNGTSSYWNTSFNTTSSALNSFGLWVWHNTVGPAGTSVATIGNGGAGSAARTFLAWVNGGTQEAGTIAGTVGAEYTQGTTVASTGLLGVTVNGSRSCQFYKNGVATGTPTTQGSTYFNGNIYFGCYNLNGTASLFTTRRLSFFIISTGLSVTDCANLYSDVLAFQTALTRN